MNGEPLVEDFQTRYTTAKPKSTQRFADPISTTGSAFDDLPGSPSFSQYSDSDEAPAPPDFSGRTYTRDLRYVSNPK